MSIYVTRNKGVPRRLNAYGLNRPGVRDIVDATTAPVTEAAQPEVPDYVDGSTSGSSEIVPPPVVSATGISSDTVQQGAANLAVLMLPFFAYLTFFSNRLPGWARMTSALLGAGVLFADGGLVQSWSARNGGEQPLFQGMADCGCGCGGKPGGCGG